MDNRVSRLIGPNGAYPDVARSSGIYCTTFLRNNSAIKRSSVSKAYLIYILLIFTYNPLMIFQQSLFHSIFFKNVKV